MKKKVFVGVSGGVDSSVSALLLKKEYEVVGVHFINFDSTENLSELSDALGIKIISVDFQKEFKQDVITPFINSYKKGLTPNPCIHCNEVFKFDRFARWCFDNGAQYIATGHYAQTADGRLFRGNDNSKDQSYFLNRLSSEILQKTIFPIGDLTKEEVREIAKINGLPNNDKKDSQEICFLKNRDLHGYLDEHIDSVEGNIIDIDTREIVGRHNNIFQFTLGQRKGIQIGGVSKPYFVADKDIYTGNVYVANGRMHEKLWKDTFEVDDFNTIHQSNRNLLEDLKCMVRYRSTPVPCEVAWDEDKIRVFLSKKVWLSSPGQSLVLYRDDECIGGGVISRQE